MILCTICTRGPIVAACQRCARPFCLEHQPRAEMRCNHCEVDFVRASDSIRYGLWNLLGVAVVVALVSAVWPHLPHGRQGGMRAITTGSAHLDVLIMGGFAAWFLARSFAGVRAYVARRVFLAERPTQA